ncbi:unnamed protein product [Rotaria sp. Silwood2]|nr:unnamed protein product [Rotaria sp. Silwood2]
MGLLPAYMDKIDELALSEHKTHGQIYTFLITFPKFTLFTQLRRLYFQIDMEACDEHLIQKAITSLSKTNIDALAIKVIGLKEQKSMPYGLNLPSLFALSTLKKFSFATDAKDPFYYSDNLHICSKIEYLTISDPVIAFDDLPSLLYAMPNLEHLNVRLTSADYHFRQQRRIDLKTDLPSIPTLKTCILQIENTCSVKFNLLAHFLKAMPALRHLGITASYELFNAHDWEMLLTTSLTALTHLRLHATITYHHDDVLPDLLDPFKTSFWIEKKIS